MGSSGSSVLLGGVAELTHRKTRRKKALVLGATGHLGQAIVRELGARGWHITAATRRASPRALADLDVDVVRGDADHPGQLDAWTIGHDVVVDAAAPHPLGPFPGDEIARAEYRTRALIDAVAKHGARLAFISSCTTLGRREDSLASLETSWRRGAYPYFRVKQRMEDMIVAATREGLPAVIVNPAACLGPWEYDAARSFVYLVATGRVPAVMRQTINVIDVRDVASNLHAALAAERYGRQIPLAGHNITVDDLARRVASLANVAPPGFAADARVAALAAFWTDAVASLAGGTVSNIVRAAPLIADAQPMEQSAEQRRLGVGIRPLDETLRDAVAWHLTSSAHASASEATGPAATSRRRRAPG